MNLRLDKLTYENKDKICEMLDEWREYNKTTDDDRSPWAIFKNDHKNFDYYIENLVVKEPKDGMVPDSTFFCCDEDRDIYVGAVNIRHYLNESLSLTGGHIGDGIRPSERRKGYGTKMLSLALDECRKLGLSKVLITCSKGNIGSEKAIVKNGGVFENEVEENGNIVKRFWITL